jgi:hypothetical protein
MEDVEDEEVNIGSIAGLNGSGVHDQSAYPPPTRTNVKRKQKTETTTKKSSKHKVDKQQ